MKKQLAYLLSVLMTFAPAIAFSAGRIQNEDVKTLSQITAAGGTAANLINDTKIYVSANGLNDQLSNLIVNGKLDVYGVGVLGIELLSNGDFEHGGVTNGYTATSLTAANVTSGTSLIEKKSSASITATAVSQTFQSTAVAIQGLANGNCSASLRYLYSGTAGDWQASVVSSVAGTISTLSLPVSTNSNSVVTLPVFACGTAAATTLQFVLTSKVAAPGTLYFDNIHLGSVQALPGSIVSTDNSGITYINTSQAYTAVATIPNTIETAFGNTTAGAFTLTLPDPTLNKSKKLIISKTNATAPLLTVTGNIAGTASRSTVLHAQGENITLQSDGTTWQWLSDPSRTVSASYSAGSALNVSSGNWTTAATNTAPGQFTLTLAAGVFTVNPVCTSNVNSGSPGNTYVSQTGASTTSINVATNSGTAATSAGFSIICHGAR